jgi:hypothetical protein
VTRKKYCVYCSPVDLSSIKGTIFHPIGEKVKCPSCKREIRKGQIVVLIEVKGGG